MHVPDGQAFDDDFLAPNNQPYRKLVQEFAAAARRPAMHPRDLKPGPPAVGTASLHLFETPRQPCKRQVVPSEHIRLGNLLAVRIKSEMAVAIRCRSTSND